MGTWPGARILHFVEKPSYTHERFYSVTIATGRKCAHQRQSVGKYRSVLFIHHWPLLNCDLYDYRFACKISKVAPGLHTAGHHTPSTETSPLALQASVTRL